MNSLPSTVWREANNLSLKSAEDPLNALKTGFKAGTYYVFDRTTREGLLLLRQLRLAGERPSWYLRDVRFDPLYEATDIVENHLDRRT